MLAALADAGLAPGDVDGLATHHVLDSVSPHVLSRTLGLTGVEWLHEEYGGGSKSHVILEHAAHAIHAGAADCVVVYRALNGRSGHRMGGSGGAAMALPESDYERPHGLLAPVQIYALMARAHMQAYGTTADQLGTVGVVQRQYAHRNDRAMQRDLTSLDDYRAAPMVADPFRLLDCCLETDGACAVVLVSAERARDLVQRPVRIAAARSRVGWNLVSGSRFDLTVTPAADLAPLLFRDADLTPTDVDVAELYDCFSYTVIAQLEDYGFCAKGEGGPLVESGATGPGGRIPVNTHGGFLSEGYLHGLNHLCEAVDQLRGTAGARQVPDARVALSTGQPGYATGVAAAVLLSV